MRRIAAKTIYAQYCIALDMGLDAELQRQATGVEPATFADPELMLEEAQVFAHLDLARAELDGWEFVRRVGLAQSVSSMGILGLSVRASKTLGEAARRLIRFYHLVNTLAEVDMVQRGDEVVWLERRPGQRTAAFHMATTISMLGAMSVTRELTGDTRSPLRVRLTQPDPNGLSAIAASFNCPVEYGGAGPEIAWPADIVDHPLPQADADLEAYFLGVLDARDQASPKLAGELLAEVRRCVMARLPGGAPGIDEVAQAMGMSRRTLQRRLADFDTNFAELMVSIREALAERYLHDRTLSIAEVAHLLGYTEVNSFFRAFRRWKGTAPQQYRAGLWSSGP